MHYLLNFSKDRMAAAVNQGVEDARAWCRARNIPLQPGPAYPPPPATAKTSVTFTEEMKGFVDRGSTATSHDEYQAAAANGKARDEAFMFHLDVSVADVDAFLASPAHQARADGYIDSPLFGGRRPVADGTVNLLVNGVDPTKKHMRYRCYFTASDGREYTLAGVKDIEGPAFTTVWAETTTLYTLILDGRVADGQPGTIVAAGVLVIRPEDFFLRQLFSFRTTGPTPAARLDGLNRFGAMFMGQIWDVYGRQVGPA